MPIFKCDCSGMKYGNQGAKFQDEKYGLGMRVFVQSEKEAKKYSCTVCGKEKRTEEKKKK